MFLLLGVFLYSSNLENKYVSIFNIDEGSCSIKFKDIIKNTLGNHPSIMVSKEMLQSADKSIESAKWGYYPSPSIDYSYKNQNENSITFRVDQPIWTGGKLDAIYKKANSLKEEANSSLDENRYKIIENNLKTLKSYLQAKNRLKVLDENISDYKLLESMLNRMMNAGVLSQADKNLLDSKISILQTDILVTKSKLKVSKIQFEILTGKKIPCEIEFEYKSIFDENINIEKLVKSLSINHPSLNLIDSKIKKMIAELDETKSKIWPTLSLRAEHKDGALYKSSDDINENIAYLAISISPGAGLSAKSNIEKSKIEVNKVKYERLSKEKELIDLLMSDYISFIKLKSGIKLLKNDISTAQQIYESNNRLFLSEKKSWLDVVNSLSEVSKYRINYSEQNIEKEILEYMLLLKSGQINLENFEVISVL